MIIVERAGAFFVLLFSRLLLDCVTRKFVFMETKTAFKCETCGFISDVREEVIACENRGRQNKFQKDDRVIVQTMTMAATGNMDHPEYDHVRGRVIEIHFSRQTHEVSYDVEFNEGNKEIIGFF